jgi:hypothetical protein
VPDVVDRILDPYGAIFDLDNDSLYLIGGQPSYVTCTELVHATLVVLLTRGIDTR